MHAIGFEHSSTRPQVVLAFQKHKKCKVFTTWMNATAGQLAANVCSRHANVYKWVMEKHVRKSQLH
jgi:hypothetical protein